MGKLPDDFAAQIIRAHQLTRDIDIGLLMVERKYDKLAQCLTEASQLLAAAAELVKSYIPKTSPRFPEVSCSQCGQSFGPGDHGFSDCESHRSLHGH